MKPDQLPVVANQAVQNKLAQAQREVMMLQVRINFSNRKLE